jgi:hypothetical protein
VPFYLPDSIGSHALIGHSLIVLLLAVPSLVIAGMGLSRRRSRIFLGSAFALMVLCTAFSFASFATGEIAVKSASVRPGFWAALDAHRSVAETTRELFCLLTLGFGALLLAPKVLQRELEFRVNTALLAVFLIFYASGALLLINTAQQGDRLARKLQPKTASYSLSGKEGVR